jgi:hypothetical protein
LLRKILIRDRLERREQGTNKILTLPLAVELLYLDGLVALATIYLTVSVEDFPFP